MTKLRIFGYKKKKRREEWYIVAYVSHCGVGGSWRGEKGVVLLWWRVCNVLGKQVLFG